MSEVTLPDEFLADLAKRLVDDPRWLAEKAKIAARRLPAGRKARREKEALERYARRAGLVPPDLDKELAGRRWLRTINYHDVI